MSTNSHDAAVLQSMMTSLLNSAPWRRRHTRCGVAATARDNCCGITINGSGRRRPGQASRLV